MVNSEVSQFFGESYPAQGINKFISHHSRGSSETHRLNKVPACRDGVPWDSSISEGEIHRLQNATNRLVSSLPKNQTKKQKVTNLHFWVTVWRLSPVFSLINWCSNVVPEKKIIVGRLVSFQRVLHDLSKHAGNGGFLGIVIVSTGFHL